MKLRCAPVVVLLAAARANAQQLHGIVRDSIGGLPVPGAVVSLLDSAGNTLDRTIGGADGSFRIAGRSAAAARLRVIRIGFVPREIPLHTRDAPGAQVIVPMSRIPTRLTEVRVEDRPVCPGEDAAADAVQLWEQARAGLLAAIVAREAHPGNTSVLRYTRDLEPVDDVVVRQDARMLSGRAMRPFATFASPSELARRGYMLSGDGVRSFDAPDADVLLDDTFASAHCFSVTADDLHRGLVGLVFTPAVVGDGKVDVEGVLWMDMKQAILRRIDFHYTGLSADETRAGAGGSLSFQTMTNGLAFIDSWELHLPLFQYDEVLGTGRSTPRLVGTHVDGGVVAAVVWPDGSRFSTSLGVIDGRVLQRGTQHPVRAAAVSLAGTNSEATSDSAGVFLMPALVPGRYRVMAGDTAFAAFARPRRGERVVEVHGGDTIRLALELPAHASVVAQLCRGSGRAAGSVLLGQVVGERPPGLRIAALWMDEVRVAPERRGATITTDSARRLLIPDDAGRFVVCGVQPGRLVRLTPATDATPFRDTVVTAGYEPVHVDVRLVARALAAHPATAAGRAHAPSNDVETSDLPLEIQMQAKAAGLVIVPAAGGVQIHGPSSFMSNRQPLYIVDGVPWTGGSGDILAGLNPHDIASIKLLKKPEELGIYGVRGANGVIMITTKKGPPQTSRP